MSKKKARLKEKKDSQQTSSESLFNYKINQRYHLSDKQLEFVNLARKEETKIILCDGVAGTSKTFLSVLIALEMLKERKINEIIYVRSIVESASRSLGSLPGEMESKFYPYSIPLLEKCDELIEPSVSNNLLKNGYIRCLPVNYLRGTTFKDCVVIIDENQNNSRQEITTIISRFGQNCKMFIIGDSFQSDIKESGFKLIFDAFNTEISQQHGIFCKRFGKEDIVRSKLLRYIVEVLENIKK